MDPLLIASICHEANRAYCNAVGDNSQPSWEEAEQWQRDSAIAGVQAALSDESKTPESLHQEWSEYKFSTGWTYGPEKDAEKKTHPCLVPYDQLPETQRIKDHLFLAIVRTIAGNWTGGDIKETQPDSQ